MRRTFIILWSVVCFVFGGATGFAVQESMEIPYSGAKLSHLSFRCGGVGYTKIFSSVGTSDATQLWNDLIVFNNMGIKTVELYINSPGGDAYAGLSVADQIESARFKGMTINGHATGIVASAAIPILAVCSNRTATAGTVFMVHEAALWKWPGRETASDIRSQNDLMLLLRERYISTLVRHSDLPKEEWEAMEKKTTWFSARDALVWGLIDAVQ